MGEVNKAELEYDGRTFAQRVISEMEMTGMPCYMSLANYEQKLPEGWTAVKDDVNDSDDGFIGPMGGIYSCLKLAEADGLDGLFFAPCDAPFFSRVVIEKLAGFIGDDTGSACWRTSDGRIQTTFGWYSVKIIPILKEDIENRRYKLLKSVERSPLRIVDTQDACVDEKAFANINTEKDYLNIRRSEPEFKHILICGDKGAGKTTLIKRVMAETSLPVFGYRTAVGSIDDDGIKSIHMYPVADSDSKGTIIGHTNNRVLDVRYETFDDLGVSLISEDVDDGILIMDEIGHMEIGSDHFCNEVLRAFDGDDYILASIKSRDQGYKYLRAIKNHPSVKLFEITEGNRETVYADVKEIVRSWESEWKREESDNEKV